MIVTVIGARPQFIKAAVVSMELKEIGIEETIIHTGQHYDAKMSDVFWRELGLPNYEINLNVGSGTHGEQTAAMIIKLEQYFLSNSRPVEGVLLYGDTNSTMAGAVVASKLGIKIIHIESGLRSFNKAMPEEINRIVTDHLSDILFCPSQSAVNQLEKEGISKNVYNSGDVMFDAQLRFSQSTIKLEIENELIALKKFYLITIHRPSNTDHIDNMRSILAALHESNANFVWPIHPRTKRLIEENNIAIPINVKVFPPFSYFEMIVALKNCSKVLTDSGGLQKEAYWMHKPCVTLRTETEWIETLHHNWNILSGPDTQMILEALNAEVSPDTWCELYGNGRASRDIAETLKKLLY